MGFGERVKDAMLEQGLEGPAALARIAGISETEARMWLLMEEADVPARLLVPVVKRLRVRMYWLATGESVPQISGTLTEQDREALEIIAGVSRENAAHWLRIGKRMIR